MTKTFKTCVIFSISAVWLVLMRILFSYINIGDYLSDWLFSLLVQVIGMGVIPLTLYKFWVKEDPLKGFYIKPKLSPAIYLLTIAIGIVVCFLLPTVAAMWQMLLQLVGYTRVNAPGVVYPAKGAIWIMLAELCTTAILPGVFEELNYRGLSMRMFSEVEDETKKIIFIAFLFGLGHQFIAQTCYAYVAGLIFAYVAVKTRSVIPGMIMHFMNNAVYVINDYSSQTTGVLSGIRDTLDSVIFANVYTIIIFCGGFTALAVLLLKLVKRYSQEEVKENADGKEEYYYPGGKIQYVDDIFGDLIAVKEAPEKTKTRWYEYAPLYAAVVLTTLVTIFTFVWGLAR